MKKIISLHAILILSFLCIGCTKEEKNDWNPPIKGLTWGMSMDDVKEVLDGKESELSKVNNTTYMTVKEKCKTKYGVKMVSTFAFDKDLKLYQFVGSCDEPEISVIKDKLEEIYGDYSSSSKPSDGTQWDSERVLDRKDYEEVMKRFYIKFGSLPEYDGLKTGFEISPLVSFKLIETGDQIGTLIVNGGKQVAVDALLSD